MIEKMLYIAASEAKRGVDNKDGGPFGAVITNEKDEIIASSHNMVLKTNDPTNHAEIVAIREACYRLNTHDLSNCTIYCSCEPCPMCLSAIIWANIKTIYYCSTRSDAASIGFRDDLIYDYLNNKNTIVSKHQIENQACLDLLDNYKGEMY